MSFKSVNCYLADWSALLETAVFPIPPSRHSVLRNFRMPLKAFLAGESLLAVGLWHCKPFFSKLC